jgi:hypothetical protein
MVQGYIVDPETGRNVAIIRGGEVFRDDGKWRRFAIVLNEDLFDLRGELIGRLEGQHVVDASTRCMPMPIAFKNLLEG